MKNSNDLEVLTVLRNEGFIAYPANARESVFEEYMKKALSIERASGSGENINARILVDLIKTEFTPILIVAVDAILIIGIFKDSYFKVYHIGKSLSEEMSPVVGIEELVVYVKEVADKKGTRLRVSLESYCDKVSNMHRISPALFWAKKSSTHAHIVDKNSVKCGEYPALLGNNYAYSVKGDGDGKNFVCHKCLAIAYTMYEGVLETDPISVLDVLGGAVSGNYAKDLYKSCVKSRRWFTEETYRETEAFISRL